MRLFSIAIKFLKLIGTFKNFKKSPLALLLIIFIVGSYLIKGESGVSFSSIIGTLILFHGVFLLSFVFLIYVILEMVTNILRFYDDALKNISKTHSSFEKHQQRIIEKN